ncbi:MAG: TlpA disulfide reductase family protein [Gammaproteobacteria bacterium]
MKTKSTLIALSALVLVTSMAFAWFSLRGLTDAPPVTLKTIKGQSIALESLRGHPVLINFWATTCPACIKEMPHISELYTALAPAGLQIISIAMAYDPPNRVIELAEARQIPYPIALDLDGKAAAAFGNVRLTPTTFLIAPDGKIAFWKTGELNFTTLHQQINAMLTTSGKTG